MSWSEELTLMFVKKSIIKNQKHDVVCDRPNLRIIYHSIQKPQNRNRDFSKVIKYFLIKIEIKNEPCLKTPNLQGFLLTPNIFGERSSRKVTLYSLVGVP